MAPASPDEDGPGDDEAPDDGALPPSNDDDASGDTERSTRRRILPVILLVGAVVAGAPMLEGVGDRRELVVRLDEPADLTGISLILRDGDEALWGTERQFAAGSAPPKLTRTLPLPAGRYLLVVRLDHGSQSRTLERHFEVLEDASQVIVPIAGTLR